ncbi:MAG: hypothetical protein ACI8X5_002043 [Planctomycetota bacterium]|jgi:hypothetical protein
MNLQSTVNHFENYLRVEIESKRCALLCIETQERAIEARDADAFQESVSAAQELCVSDERNAVRRKKLMSEMANHWGIPVATMTLGGIARRLGAQGKGVELLRLKLRTAVAEVVKRNRRLAALIGMHRRINADVMQIVLGCDSHEAVNNGGSLINAEA